MASVILVVAWLTGGDMARAIAFAAVAFVGRDGVELVALARAPGTGEAARAMSATETVEATVEALCGDLGRDPRAARDRR